MRLVQQKSIHEFLNEKCKGIEANDRYDECRRFYRNKIRQSKNVISALIKQLDKNIEVDIEERCGGILNQDQTAVDGDRFFECSSKVSKDYITKIPEYLKFIHSINEILKSDIKEFR